jgi:hypothetical protein
MELKPCTCGKRPVVMHRTVRLTQMMTINKYFVKCESCGLSNEKFEQTLEANAIEDWNNMINRERGDSNG